MNDVYEQIKFFVNSIWQRRSSALAVAWFVCLAGWIVVATMPNSYKSSARIFIDTSNILRPLLKGLAVETDVEAELELMRRTLTSHASLANVARLTDLDLTASSPTEMQALLDSLKSRTGIKSEGRKLLTISFVDSDPVRARDVTQALITTYIEMNLGHGREDIDAARQFLDSRIAEYEQQLQQAETKLANFKQEKLSKLPNQANAQLRIEALRNDRLEVEAALRKAASERDLLLRQLAAPGSVVGDPRIEEIMESLSDLLSRYTEQHPEVLALRRKLEALRKARDLDSLAKPADALAGTSQIPLISDEPDWTNRAVAKIKLDLAQHETDIAFYEGRVSRITRQINNLDRTVAQIPEVEAELTRLNRDYEVLKLKNFELLGRREQARISGERDIRVDDIKFRVLEPPRVPGSPTGPSRSLLLLVSLFGGIGAGTVFALLLGLLSNAVTDPEQLRESFGLPILGTVSTIDSFKHHSLRLAQTSAFFTGLALLFVTFAGLVMIERESGLANLASNKHINAAYEQVGAASGRLKSVIAEVIDRI